MPSLVVVTGWPSKELSPNGAQRNFHARSRARKNARNEGYLATCEALSREDTRGWKLAPGTIKLTIHAQPKVKRQRDDDNLISSTKGFRDGIAQKLQVNDALFALQPVDWLDPDPDQPGRLFFEIELQS